MARNEITRMFDQLESMSVGFGPLFKDFTSPTPSYPPHNIVSIDDNTFVIELAVAGFKKDEISLEEFQGSVTVKGVKEETKCNNYIYRGIAKRSFSRTFRVAEYFKVTSAIQEDGLLSITFVKDIPEASRPKLITIK